MSSNRHEKTKEVNLKKCNYKMANRVCDYIMFEIPVLTIEIVYGTARFKLYEHTRVQ